jgi:hypothetical protein
MFYYSFFKELKPPLIVGGFPKRLLSSGRILDGSFNPPPEVLEISVLLKLPVLLKALLIVFEKLLVSF